MESEKKNSKGSDSGLFATVRRMDERLEEYGWPLRKELLFPLNIFDKAHTVMLTEQGIISPNEGRLILSVLSELDQISVDSFPWGKGDLWAQKERYVISELGEEVGGRLHTGRSRQDVGVTTNRLHLRSRLLEAANTLNDFRRALLSLAEAHVETVMPCYTWTQQAQPTTFAHYLMSLSYAMERDTVRILRAFELTNQCPAGAALQTGTSHPIDRQRTCDLMGFQKVIRNTRDAAMNFDYLYETAVACSMALGDLVRLLEDFAVWHSLEFNMISLDDAWCGTSSIMPQKRNPYPFMVIRGKAAKSFSRTSGVFSTLEGPTLGPSAPFYLQADIDELLDEFVGAFIIATGFLPTIRVNVEVMRMRAGEFWAQATDLADMIVKEKGLPFRTSHHIVAELVKDANEDAISPSEVDPRRLDRAAISITGEPIGLPFASIQAALDPEKAVRTRKVIGGTSPADVAQQIAESRQQLKRDTSKVKSYEKALVDSERMLATVVDSLIESGGHG